MSFRQNEDASRQGKKQGPSQPSATQPQPVKSKPAPSSSSAASQPSGKPPGRLVSLDAFRGFIMIMLVADGFGLRELIHTPEDNPLWSIVNRNVLERIAFHFQHPPWESSIVPGAANALSGSAWLHMGVSFWDLIQPAFMFMVGVALPYSYARRSAMGQPAWKRHLHAATRALVLVLMGVFLYSLWTTRTNWIFPNVLAQIGLGYFFVYLLLGRRHWIQWTALGVILVGTWLGVHFYPPPADYDPAAVNAHYELGEIYAPPYRQWSKNGNAFHTFDVWFLNLFPRPAEEGPFLFNPGGYQTLNFIPAMGTMLMGLMCGQLLLSSLSPRRKLLYLVLAALVCWGLGLVAGATCCPIVKRIWTPAWVLFSGGYVIGILALFYLFFDIFPFRKLAFPLVIVGMNSILVYFLAELIRPWLAANVQRHFGGAIRAALGWMGQQFHWLDGVAETDMTAGMIMQTAFDPVIASVSALLVIWLLCWWLYRQRVFLRI